MFRCGSFANSEQALQASGSEAYGSGILSCRIIVKAVPAPHLAGAWSESDMSQLHSTVPTLPAISDIFSDRHAAISCSESHVEKAARPRAETGSALVDLALTAEYRGAKSRYHAYPAGER
nr:hypothetical protein CFP56_70037 [Quercus suber]